MIPVNIESKFNQVNEYWHPYVIGELNGQAVKIAKLKGEFIWHDHKDEDELFLIVKGNLIIEFRDSSCELSKGEICIIPKGTEHKPIAEEEVWVMLFEPLSTKHTGETKSERTVETLDYL